MNATLPNMHAMSRNPTCGGILPTKTLPFLGSLQAKTPRYGMLPLRSDIILEVDL
jgi:hypothetical protein